MQGSTVPPALAVQRFPDRLEEQGEILPVLRAVDDPGGAALDGILPVQIDAVQVMAQHQVQAALGEGLPPGGGGGRIGEVGGLVPAADGEDNL